MPLPLCEQACLILLISRVRLAGLLAVGIGMADRVQQAGEEGAFGVPGLVLGLRMKGDHLRMGDGQRQAQVFDRASLADARGAVDERTANAVSQATGWTMSQKVQRLNLAWSNSRTPARDSLGLKASRSRAPGGPRGPVSCCRSLHGSTT